MVRIAISVEGTSEERFVSQLLSPHFNNFGIDVTAINMNGNISVDRVAYELKRLIYNFDYVTTLYDFYGFKNIQDGDTKQSLEQKIIDKLKKSAAKDKVIPYIQMYEFEGLLFSCPKTISEHLQDKKLEQWAVDILNQFGNNPERINNSKDTAPSKRLENGAHYRKTTHGPNIAKGIGLQKLRDKCQGFNEWISKLEGLGKCP